MPTALDRLLARPSTLRLLRIIAATQELPWTAPCRHASVLSPAHTNSQDEARQGQNIGEAVVQIEIPGEDIKKAIQEKLRASQEGVTQPTAGFSEISQVEAWVGTIQRAQRIHGSSVIKTAWEILREDQVDLPTKGPQARAAWGLLIAEDDLLESVVSYAFDLKRRTGQVYENLYESILCHFFAKQQHAPIYEWHEKLINDFPPAPGGLKEIASHIYGSKAAYKAFRWIYHRNTQHDVYDTIVPSLYRQGKPAMALNLQVWLLSRGDGPRGSRRLEEIEEIEKLPTPSRGRYKRRDSDQISPSPSDHSESAAIYLRQLETLGMRPKKVDDEFCARLFATKALGINLAVNCLLRMNCTEIGSLSMRELAFRSKSCKSVVQNIRKIVDLGMAIKRTTYNRAIMRFAVQNREELLQSLLETDHHPDNFDDTKLQNKLLDFYIRTNDWSGINRTLAILTVSKRNSKNEEWNILVRAMSKRDYTSWEAHIAQLSRMLEEAQITGLKIGEETLDTLQGLLRMRNPGHAPTTTAKPGTRDDVWFANVCCLALKSGTQVDPSRWVELLRRFGMTERFDHVYHLAIWLANFYTTTHNLPENLLREFNHHFNKDEHFIGDSFAIRGVPLRQPTDLLPWDKKHPLRQIFNAHTLRGIVAWSIRRDFIVPHKGRQKRPHHWTRGLVLLRLLHEKGIHVPRVVVRKELNIQFLRLFGRAFGIYDGLLRRRFRLHMRSRRNNPYSLPNMVEQANTAFSGTAGGKAAEPLLDLEEVAQYIVETGRSRLWRMSRWRIRHQPRQGRKKAQKQPSNMGLWSQLKL